MTGWTLGSVPDPYPLLTSTKSPSLTFQRRQPHQESLLHSLIHIFAKLPYNYSNTASINWHMSFISQAYPIGISQAYLSLISGIFYVYPKQISGISQAYHKQIPGLSQAYFKQISGISLTCLMSKACLRHIPSISQVYLIYISSIFHAFFMHISGLSQAYLKHR